MNEIDTVTFTKLRCSHCDIAYYVPETFDESKRKTGQAFVCPNGHPSFYQNSPVAENAKLKKKVAELEASLKAALTRIQLAEDQQAAAETALEEQKKEHNIWQRLIGK